MVVTDLPALARPKDLSDGEIEGLMRAMSAGIHPRTLAKRLAPDDRRKRTRIYRRLVMAITEDERVAKRMQTEVATSFAVGLLPAVDSLGHRAGRGRDVRAIKLLLEATGVHNPRIQHEHSGEIRIKFDIPRPTFESDDDIVDADVVD